MGGFHLGNVVGLILTPIMLTSVGISGPFVLFSSLGLLWLSSWMYKVTSDPRESRFISSSELRLIQSGKSDSANDERPPLRLLFSKLPTWAIIFANFTNNWVCVLPSWFRNIPSDAINMKKTCLNCRDTLCYFRGCLFTSRQ